MGISAMEKVYDLSNTIIKLVYINILIILFSIIGLLVFGFFPAILASFSVSYKWIKDGSNLKITRNFWNVYKRDFIKSNVMGYICAITLYLLYINLSISNIIENKYIRLTYYPILTVLLLFILTCVFIFPVYIHFNKNIIKTIKKSFILLFITPINSIILVAGIYIIFMVMKIIPGLIPFFGFSLLVMFITIFSIRSFTKIEEIYNI